MAVSVKPSWADPGLPGRLDRSGLAIERALQRGEQIDGLAATRADEGPPQ
jgi:hypothetical protein